MNPTLILISGLPGCGKTTLARLAACELSIPLFAKDRFQSALRREGLADRETADGYHLLLDMADEQLSLGVSAILDAVFPLPGFRDEAAQIAGRHQAAFRPVMCICSDEREWERRMGDRRHVYVPHWTPVGWEAVQRLREQFMPWDADKTLVLDAMNPLESNLDQLRSWILRQ